MQKKRFFLLLFITLIIITPIGSAFSFEKNYYVIVEDYELNESIRKEKIELFNSIEDKWNILGFIDEWNNRTPNRHRVL